MRRAAIAALATLALTLGACDESDKKPGPTVAEQVRWANERCQGRGGVLNFDDADPSGSGYGPAIVTCVDRTVHAWRLSSPSHYGQ